MDELGTASQFRIESGVAILVEDFGRRSTAA
jgi:hypothetical protein